MLSILAQGLLDALGPTADTVRLINETRKHPIADTAITAACKANNARNAAIDMERSERLDTILDNHTAGRASNPTDKQILNLKTVSKVTVGASKIKNLLSLANVVTLARHLPQVAPEIGYAAFLTKGAIDVSCSLIDVFTNTIRPTVTEQQRKTLVRNESSRYKTWNNRARGGFSSGKTSPRGIQERRELVDETIKKVANPSKKRWWWSIAASTCRVGHATLSLASAYYDDDPEIREMSSFMAKASVACLIGDIFNIICDRKKEITDLGSRINNHIQAQKYFSASNGPLTIM